jgi:hypothetical protein
MLEVLEHYYKLWLNNEILSIEYIMEGHEGIV